jgi:site-specific recombinase XerD
MIHKHNYLQWLKTRELQPRTIQEYGGCLDNLTQFPTFNQKNVDKFMAQYKGNVIRSFLRSYKKYLLRNPDDLNISFENQKKIKFIDIPSVKSKKRKTPEIITLAEMKAIYHHMPTEEKKLLLLLSFFCGLRKAELLSLRCGMFNINEWEKDIGQMGTLTIVGKGKKVGTIPVKQVVMQKVYDYIPENFKEETLLFPNMTPRTWNNVLSRASKPAIGKHVKPHTLRHSSAMHLRGHDFELDEIKEFLRHEDIGTTQIYSRVTPEQLREKFKDL